MTPEIPFKGGQGGHGNLFRIKKETKYFFPHGFWSNDVID